MTDTLDRSDEPSRCNCATLRRAMRKVTRFYDACLAPAGVGVNQFTLLGYLKHRGPVRMLDLAEMLAMDRATIGHNLKPLERDGLITVVIDPSDRRARLVGISPAGLGKIDQARGLWDMAQQGFESETGTAEAAELRHMLNLVAAVPFATAGQNPSLEGSGYRSSRRSSNAARPSAVGA